MKNALVLTQPPAGEGPSALCRLERAARGENSLHLAGRRDTPPTFKNINIWYFGMLCFSGKDTHTKNLKNVPDKGWKCS